LVEPDQGASRSITMVEKYMGRMVMSGTTKHIRICCMKLVYIPLLAWVDYWYPSFDMCLLGFLRIFSNLLRMIAPTIPVVIIWSMGFIVLLVLFFN
jgi:hypothetical protein